MFSIASHTNPEQHTKPSELLNNNSFTIIINCLQFACDNGLAFAISLIYVKNTKESIDQAMQLNDIKQKKLCNVPK